MLKEDMIIGMIKQNDKNNKDEHKVLFDKIDKISVNRKMSSKEILAVAGIVSGMIGTVCATILKIVGIGG